MKSITIEMEDHAFEIVRKYARAFGVTAEELAALAFQKGIALVLENLIKQLERAGKKV